MKAIRAHCYVKIERLARENLRTFGLIWPRLPQPQILWALIKIGTNHRSVQECSSNEVKYVGREGRWGVEHMVYGKRFFSFTFATSLFERLHRKRNLIHSEFSKSYFTLCMFLFVTSFVTSWPARHYFNVNNLKWTWNFYDFISLIWFCLSFYF